MTERDAVDLVAVAAALEVPAGTLESRVESLSAALTDLRKRPETHKEAALVQAWRASFEGREGLLDSPRDYLDIARAVNLYLKVLEGGEDETVRDIDMNSLAEGGFLIGMLFGRSEDNQVEQIFTQAFQRDGMPLSAAASDLGAVFGAMRQIKLMREYLAMAEPLTVDAVHRLWDYCLGAHALAAPDSLWQLIDAKAASRQVEARPVSSDEPVFDPNTLTETIVKHEVFGRSRVKATTTQYEQHRQVTGGVYADLREGRLSSDTERHLRAAGLDVRHLKEVLAQQAQYNAAGFVKKAMIGDSTPRLRMECQALLDGWQRVGTRLKEAADQAAAERASALELSRQPVQWLTSNDNPLLRMLCDPPTSYVGEHLVAADVPPYLPNRLWVTDPVPGVEWVQLPWLNWNRRSTFWFAGSPGLAYEEACEGVRGLVLDQMSRTVPRRLQLTWIDPTSRGGSAGALLELLEIDKDLFDTQAWSEPDQITAALRRISDHISYIEQRCLKDRFADIDEYNGQAGSLAEADRVVVVSGFPQGFTQESIDRLEQIVTNGARVGVTVHIVTAPAVGQTLRVGMTNEFPSVQGWGNGGYSQWNANYLGGLPVFGHAGRIHAQVPVSQLDSGAGVPVLPISIGGDLARGIVEGYANAAVAATNVVVDAEALTASASDGIHRSVDEVVLPLGIMGRGDKLDLRLGKGLQQNVLVGGLPGSGKSTLFHTIITSAVRRYEPSELDLYLLDFKQGVEFQPYAVGGLPHARVVAVQSEREFGLSVLRSLRQEIDRRAELFRGPAGLGADSLSEYRARTGEVMPRVLLVIDEFQVLFADSDEIASECLQLLDHIVRQGRAFGIHSILGTQTLRGHGSMTQLRGTLDQIAIRIVLKTSESDSRLFLSDDNPAGSRLTRPGEAVFNGDGGRIEGNLVFQVAVTADENRDAAVSAARVAADQSGFLRRPLIFDGTREVTLADDESITNLLSGSSVPDRRALHLHLGLPVSLYGDGAARLWRRSGGHLLVLGRDPERTLGALTVGLVTAQVAAGGSIDIRISENLGIDEDHADHLAHLSALLPSSSYSRRKLTAMLQEASDEVRRRVAAEDFGASRILVVINALQRARELGDANDYPEPGSPRDLLLNLLRDGADVGVHLVVVADGSETVEKRLGSSSLSEFGSRLISQCSADVSQRLIGSDRASTLGASYSYVSEPDDDRMEKIRPYGIPDPSWVQAAFEKGMGGLR